MLPTMQHFSVPVHCLSVFFRVLVQHGTILSMGKQICGEVPGITKYTYGSNFPGGIFFQKVYFFLKVDTSLLQHGAL